MFVLSSDFDVPPFSLPNLGSNNSFGDYVEALESEILKKLLGKTFYTQLIAGLAAAGSAWSAATTYGLGDKISQDNNVWTSLQAANTDHAVEEGAWWTLSEEDNIWLAIKNGADYSYGNVDYEWLGIKKMLIPYIYYSWIKDTLTDSLTGNGVVVPDTENGSVINPGSKLSAAYNKFSKLAGGNYSVENSLYGYLYVNEDAYPDFEYFPQGRLNVFNL